MPFEPVNTSADPSVLAASTAHPDRDELVEDPEPRWPAMVAMLCAGGLNYALPSELSFGPRWLLFVILGVLLIPTIFFHRTGQHRLNATLGHTTAIIMTGFLVWSVGLLVRALTHKSAHPIEAVALLHAAAFLWATNVLVFALWYWRLDAGGPNAREMRAGHASGSFLFPQMTLSEDFDVDRTGKPWSPQFADYLFLAFNTSTALSPADTATLSRWAKLLQMLQSLISLSIIVLLAARAVNILT